LQILIAELVQLSESARPESPSISMNAYAKDGGKVYQQGSGIQINS
jgi:hypothetical protein